MYIYYYACDNTCGKITSRSLYGNEPVGIMIKKLGQILKLYTPNPESACLIIAPYDNGSESFTSIRNEIIDEANSELGGSVFTVSFIGEDFTRITIFRELDTSPGGYKLACKAAKSLFKFAKFINAGDVSLSKFREAVDKMEHHYTWEFPGYNIVWKPIFEYVKKIGKEKADTIGIRYNDLKGIFDLEGENSERYLIGTYKEKILEAVYLITERMVNNDMQTVFCIKPDDECDGETWQIISEQLESFDLEIDTERGTMCSDAQLDEWGFRRAIHYIKYIFAEHAKTSISLGIFVAPRDMPLKDAYSVCEKILWQAKHNYWREKSSLAIAVALEGIKRFSYFCELTPEYWDGQPEKSDPLHGIYELLRLARDGFIPMPALKEAIENMEEWRRKEMRKIHIKYINPLFPPKARRLFDQNWSSNFMFTVYEFIGKIAESEDLY